MRCEFYLIEANGGLFTYGCRVCNRKPVTVATSDPSTIHATCKQPHEAERWSQEVCIYRGDVLRQVVCGTCGNRAKEVDIFVCTGLPGGECTDKRTSAWPRIPHCFGCEAKTIAPRPA
jgi:hypothetical protein